MAGVDSDILEWLEKYIWLVPLYPRGQSYNVLADTHIDAVSAKALSDAARCCWDAILNKDLQNFGVQVKASFDAQIAMFPNMVNDDILAQIEEYRDSVLGWKLSGAGGGGYLTFISEKPVEHALQIRIRR